MITAFLGVMKTKDDFTGPVNLNNPNEFTIFELAHKIIEITNSQSVHVFTPLPTDDPIKRKPDITLAKKEINWHPDVDLDIRLIKTIHYFENLLCGIQK